MKTLELVMAVVALVAAACFTAMSMLSDSVPLIVLYAVAATVQAGLGANGLMESLFGKNGLVCDLFARKVDATNE